MGLHRRESAAAALVVAFIMMTSLPLFILGSVGTEGPPTRALPTKVIMTKEVPYHQMSVEDLSGEASLSMVFDYLGPYISQQDIRNVTKGRFESGVAEPDEMVRATHFSDLSWYSLTQRGYRERGIGYGAFSYDWTDDENAPSPRYSSRFTDIYSIIAERHVLVCYMYLDIPPELTPETPTPPDPGNPEPPTPPVTQEDLAALEKVWRVVVGYDQGQGSGVLYVHDPLPQGTGYLGGPSRVISKGDFDKLWNVTVIEGGSIVKHRLGLSASPWTISELSAPRSAEAATVFHISANITYTAPSILAGESVQTPTAVLTIPSEFSFEGSEPSIDLSITTPGTYQTVEWSVRAPETTYAGQSITFWLNATGNVVVSYRDRIGTSTSFEVNAFGFLNHPPVISSAMADPSDVPDDGSVQPLLTCSATDQDGNLQGVTADLTPIGGSSTQKMYDDGTNGDKRSADGTYSYTISREMPQGEHRIEVTAKDTRGAKAVENITLIVEDAAVFTNPPDFVKEGVTPGEVPNDGATVANIWAIVEDVEFDINKVTADMTPVGGDNMFLLYDDGTSGDLFSDDGNFSADFTVPVEVPLGTYQIKLSADDDAGHVSSSSVWMEVVLPPVAPVVVDVVPQPEEVPNDGRTKVVLTALVTDDNDDVDEVYVDLGPVMGSERTPMKDDGKSPDGKAGDEVWSVEFVVSTSTSPGKKSRIEVTAVDSNGLVGTGAFSLEVTKANTPPTIEDSRLFGESMEPRDDFHPGDMVTIVLNVSQTEQDVLSAEMDLSQIGLSVVDLNDEGLAPDVEAGDLQFTGSFEIPENMALGVYYINLTVTDPYGGSDKVELQLKVVKKTDGKTPLSGGLTFWLPVGLGIVLLIALLALFVRAYLSKPKVQQQPVPRFQRSSPIAPQSYVQGARAMR